MRNTLWTLLAAAILAGGGCGPQEQAPDKPAAPAAAPAPVIPSQPAAPPVTVPAGPAAPEPPAAVSTRPAKAAEAEHGPVPPVASPLSGTEIPKTVTLAASQGPVTFSHLAHAKEFLCATCHVDGTPGKIVLTREAAHELCRDCHHAKGKGPTTCTGCHRQ